MAGQLSRYMSGTLVLLGMISVACCDVQVPVDYPTIQEAINAAANDTTIVVLPGTYQENLDFQGKTLIVRSSSGAELTIIDGRSSGSVVACKNGENAGTILEGFTLINGNSALGGGFLGSGGCSVVIRSCILRSNNGGLGGGVYIAGGELLLQNCIIEKNQARVGAGLYCTGNSAVRLDRCTFSRNQSQLRGGAVNCDNSTIEIINCIFWQDNPAEMAVRREALCTVYYSDVQGGRNRVLVEDAVLKWGVGNIDSDPLFVDPNNGDYHLKSEGWRYYGGSNWGFDNVTSRCIDAGNPGMSLGNEHIHPYYDPVNEIGINLRVNMGAFGGTGQASMAPHDWIMWSDVNNDQIVNFEDLALLSCDWLTTGENLFGDLDRSGTVDILDLRILINDWLHTPSHVSVNEKPTAQAGADQFIDDENEDGWEQVQLDGSASYDSDGKLVSYNWSEGGQSLASGMQPIVTLGIGFHAITLTVTDNDGGQDTDTVVVVVNVPGNQFPYADAGDDIDILDLDRDGREEITLDGSGSYDADGGIVSYIWQENQETIATGVDPNIVLPVGEHHITLRVTDNYGASDSDSITIIIRTPPNEAPRADAGANRRIIDRDRSGDETVTLDGGGSYDPDHNITSYLWKEGDNILATFASGNITLPLGVHLLSLTVTDAEGLSGSDQVMISILAPLTADSGGDRVITDYDRDGAEDVTLDASASTDPCDSIVRYLWQEQGSILADANEPVAIVSMAVGIHDITLTVTNQANETHSDTSEIIINQPPNAAAGADQIIVDVDRSGNEIVTLDGSASSDNDGTIVSYEWLENNEPIATGVRPDVMLATGEHQLTLQVKDNHDAVQTDEVTITINNPPNEPPVAYAGADLTLTDNDGDGFEWVTLQGSATDPDNNIVNFSWFKDGIYFRGGSGPTVKLPVGTNILTLKVTDAEGLSDTDQVIIIINAP